MNRSYSLEVRPLEKRVIVEFEGRRLVDSTSCLELRETAHDPRIYVPPADVDFDHLFRTETETLCPFKGVAHYYGVRVGEKEVRDAFWVYEEIHERAFDHVEAKDVRRIQGMLSPDSSKLDVRIE